MIPADLERILFARYDGDAKPPLAALCDELLAQQQDSWPRLAEGLASLESAEVREVRCAGCSVHVQFNPLRIVSTNARVDPASIRERKCFLCAGNLPPAERGILYRNEFLILCNPFPVFPRHLIISAVPHVPQSLAESLPVFLDLAADLAESFTVFYNGPCAGASAPDHLHFQAVPAGSLPIERLLAGGEGMRLIRRSGSVSLFLGESCGRTMMVLEGTDSRAVGEALLRLMGEMKKAPPDAGEPMMNVLGLQKKEHLRLVVLPRRKHRPDAFFREGDDQILVSPGAVDLGGLIVTPRERDFRILDADKIREIFEEVCVDRETAERWLRDME